MVHRGRRSLCRDRQSRSCIRPSITRDLARFLKAHSRKEDSIVRGNVESQASREHSNLSQAKEPPKEGKKGSSSGMICKFDRWPPPACECIQSTKMKSFMTARNGRAFPSWYKFANSMERCACCRTIRLAPSVIGGLQMRCSYYTSRCCSEWCQSATRDEAQAQTHSRDTFLQIGNVSTENCCQGTQIGA